MHDPVSLTYLYAAGLEPRPCFRPPPSRRRRRRPPTRAALGRLLVMTGDVLQRAGHRLLRGSAATAAASTV